MDVEMALEPDEPSPGKAKVSRVPQSHIITAKNVNEISHSNKVAERRQTRLKDPTIKGHIRPHQVTEESSDDGGGGRGTPDTQRAPGHSTGFRNNQRALEGPPDPKTEDKSSLEEARSSRTTLRSGSRSRTVGLATHGVASTDFAATVTATISPTPLTRTSRTAASVLGLSTRYYQ
ncbi:MAG: hypothetical protein J3Q66DRAFT_417071 [Benniella sp.]|nr:MAG: hypothetical protein J3Q66DRAFT_417071 [Benniella sp.]